MSSYPEPAGQRPQSALRRALNTLRPSHAHSVFTATLILTAAAFTSKIISLVRVKYLLLTLGQTPAADAFNEMFQLPDTLQYFLVGGVASISLITILTRYREAGRDAEADELFSTVFTVMSIVMVVAVVAAELLTPQFLRIAAPGYLANPETFNMCVHLTRIILPGQLFFFCGGIFSAVLVVRREFTLQAFSPLIYNLGQIVGGLLLFRTIGVSSFAWGALGGVICGPFLINGWGAYRTGLRLRFRVDLKHPGLREWFWSSLPLVLGVSLVSVDGWIINHFASYIQGSVTQFATAKQLFSVPQMLGLAAGQASLPFLATLFGKEEPGAFGRSVNESVSRIVAVSFLISAWMFPMSGMAVDFYARGGSLQGADAVTIGVYLAIFSLSLCFWSAQALYARAFYAASDTLTPMWASSAVVLASLPMYAALFKLCGARGLAYASDIGIALQVSVNALMLHKRGMVSLLGLDWKELGRTLLAAGLSMAALLGLRRLVPGGSGRLEEMLLLLGSVVIWAAVCFGVLWATGSHLPEQLGRRIKGRPVRVEP